MSRVRRAPARAMAGAMGRLPHRPEYGCEARSGWHVSLRAVDVHRTAGRKRSNGKNKRPNNRTNDTPSNGKPNERQDNNRPQLAKPKPQVQTQEAKGNPPENKKKSNENKGGAPRFQKPIKKTDIDAKKNEN